MSTVSETPTDPEQACVLLVDDNPQNLKVLYETLRDKGYQLLIANDGEKALQLARRHHPEVILLDIMMPGMDGFEVCKHLRADTDTALSAIIFLSALNDIDAKVRGFNMGGADYIAKPFQAQEVMARVDTQIRVIQLERVMQARNRQLESEQASLLNAIFEGIYGLDPQGVITFANPAAAEIAGAEQDALVGRRIGDLHFTHDSGEEASHAGRVLCRDGAAVLRRGVTMTRADGTTFQAEYRAAPRFENDELTGSVLVFRDITEELAQERALEETRELVAEQREQLAHASRLSVMGEMAAGVAHEVNQPLTAIANYVSLVCRMMEKDTLDQDALSEVLEKITAQSHRASEVIRRIRQFVHQPATGKETVDVARLLAESREFAEVDSRNNAIEVSLSIPEHLPYAVADPVQVQQVVLNLIRNALEASRNCSSEEPVEVSAEALEDAVCVRVADRGCGLPEDAEERLFQPFYSNKDEGMGIGLSLCRSLITGQNGEIGFERREGGGTVFWFSLPLVDSSAPDPD
ncbi:hybrid sensor histidine kinase/response regulator [Halovibrio salipaludis]|uniref:histidine kinase n=1 Tax=Halovibrio salipaludis TaxID=2032626 RepID=A0A2A2F676_9GAMM|nr:response regulator [Halovibrio salipaludis]PAU80139.1 hybrid sensor histidine kinase/response regulator [Halovibrio salipaludis]